MTLDLPLVARGKVREIYDAGDDRLLLVASDRISAYDHVLPTPIPDKGAVLTRLSVWWFEQLTPVLGSFGATHHLISADDVPASVAGRAMLVRRLDMLPVECVARGYLSGSGTKEYAATGSIRPDSSRARGCRSRCSRRRPRPNSASTTRRSTSRPSRRPWARRAPPSCAT